MTMEGEEHRSPGWSLSRYDPARSRQLRGSLEGLRQRGNELGINLCTYQDISESAGVQGDFWNLFGA